MSLHLKMLLLDNAHQLAAVQVGNIIQDNLDTAERLYANPTKGRIKLAKRLQKQARFLLSYKTLTDAYIEALEQGYSQATNLAGQYYHSRQQFLAADAEFMKCLKITKP